MITIKPEKIKSLKMVALQEKYQQDLNANALQIANVVADDGENEDVNKAALRVKRDTIKSKFQSDMVSLLTGE